MTREGTTTVSLLVITEFTTATCPVVSEQAKVFWAGEDVDQVFDEMFEYLNHLRKVLKKNTATDKGQAFTLTSASL